MLKKNLKKGGRMQVEQKLPGEVLSASIRGRIWLMAPNGESYFGKGRVVLLERIAEYGSISQAAKSMNMSYKKAWRLVDEMNQAAVEPLVVSETGGRQGGGTRITEAAERVIAQYHQLHAALLAFCAEQERILAPDQAGRSSG
ncbi:winged helix-turn-helix domain-containing protein [Thiomicrospira cyclica]|nr:LysR family transcriptional regulator [Thiomicrospira cyclica]